MYQADDETLTTLLQWGHARGGALAGTNHTLAERAHDAATDGLMWALKKYDPSTGRPFDHFARYYIDLAIRRAVTKARRRIARQGQPVPLGADPAESAIISLE